MDIFAKFPEEEYPRLAQFLDQSLKEIREEENSEFTEEDERRLIHFWEVITESGNFLAFFDDERFDDRYLPELVVRDFCGQTFLTDDEIYQKMTHFKKFIN